MTTNFNIEDCAVYEEILLERVNFHATRTFSLLAIASGFNPKVQIVRDLDSLAQNFTAQIYTSFLKGETVEETRKIEHEYEFNLFASWLDHLKYRVKYSKDFSWVPKTIKNRLKIRYQKIIKKSYDTVPVKITKICPHCDLSFANNMGPHIRFLKLKEA